MLTEKPISNDLKKAEEMVAEAKRLGRDDVKPEHILQFLFREELVKGTNRPIKSIPDSVIREVEKEFSVKIL